MALMDDFFPRESAPRPAVGLIVALAASKLVLHLLLSGRYGYFRDELYYLDAARHLDWGYVDFPPLVALYAKFALLLGGSLHALRLIPAVFGSGLVALSMLIAWRLGGGPFAQGLTGLCILVAPAFLAMDNFLSMNAVEPLLWMGAVYILIRIVQTGNSRLWIWFGVIAGIGLENKHSTIFFCFAVFAALIISGYLSEIRKPWIWLGGVVALLLFLPNVLWQVRHGFPTLEDLANVRFSGKNVVLGPGAFIWQQIFLLSPSLFPVWLAGLVALLRDSRLRVLGWTYLIFFVLMYALHAKHYYLFPIYPMLSAAGAIVIARWVASRPSGARLWPKAALVAGIIVLALPIDLFVLPVFSPDQYIAYSGFLNLQQVKTEVRQESRWPQIFADQFGWEDLVGEVAVIYSSLPPEERAMTAIMAGNYGEAGAIDLFGPKYGLPPAICAHQNYFYWGTHGFDAGTMIILQADKRELQRYFGQVVEAGAHFNEYGMAEENAPIYVCRYPRVRLSDVWADLKHWN